MMLGALNDWEATNILHAQEWALRQKRRRVTTEKFLKLLHLRMFDETWKWAGKYRTTSKSIGSPAHLIAPQVRDACANAEYWIDHKTFQPTEIAVRFHHRIVAIHPFANGNGRHARLLVDTLLHTLGERKLSWGSENLKASASARTRYINALKAADAGDLSLLLRIARD